MSGVTLVTATVAGRLSTHMPVRWLIGPGLFLVGIGLLLMTGLDGTSTWTHLIPGFLVAGAGSGMVNPPLASTAVGVVTPERSGMASGVNTTFRQIGIATGIAVYGSIFATSLHHKMDQTLAGTPGAAPPAALRGHRRPTGQRDGRHRRRPGPVAGSAGGRHPLQLRQHARPAVRGQCRARRWSGLVCAVGLIRSRDFVASRPPPQPEPSSTGALSGTAPVAGSAPGCAGRTIPVAVVAGTPRGSHVQPAVRCGTDRHRPGVLRCRGRAGDGWRARWPSSPEAPVGSGRPRRGPWPGEGAGVAVVDIDRAGAERVAAEIEAAGRPGAGLGRRPLRGARGGRGRAAAWSTTSVGSTCCTTTPPSPTPNSWTATPR